MNTTQHGRMHNLPISLHHGHGGDHPRLIKKKLSEQSFYIGDEPITTVAEKPIESLGGWYDATLRDT